MFGDLVDDQPLKTAPKGFSADHKHIDLLRRRSFAACCWLSEEEIYDSGFDEKVIAIYKELLPFRRYLNKAVTV